MLQTYLTYLKFVMGFVMRLSQGFQTGKNFESLNPFRVCMGSTEPLLPKICGANREYSEKVHDIYAFIRRYRITRNSNLTSLKSTIYYRSQFAVRSLIVHQW